MSKPSSAAPATAAAPIGGEIVAVPAARKTPCCFVADEDSAVRHFISLIMQGSGIDSEEFADGDALRAALERRRPDLVFLDVPLDISDATRTVKALAGADFSGALQMMSARGAAVIENVKSAAGPSRARILPGLKKPFDAAAIHKIVHDIGLGMPAPVAARVFLDDAIAKNWIEFWYQPKIDLQRKWLVGLESFARVRHPQHGVLTPNAFMPGARENGILALAERAAADALRLGTALAKLSVNVRISINMPMGTLDMLALGEIVRRVHPDPAAWPGLIVDLNEKSAIHDLPRATALAQDLEPYNVKLALDGFGHGYSAIARAPSLPFFEMKIDPSIVTNCAADADKRTICRNVIALAQQTGARAVGVGVERAADVSMLRSLRCDFGQGYLLGHPMPEARLMSLLRQRAQARADLSGSPVPQMAAAPA